MDFIRSLEWRKTQSNQFTMAGDNSLFFSSQEWLKTLSNQSTMVGEIGILGHKNGYKHQTSPPSLLEKFSDIRS